jgi:threonyl-tRNA synthetase
VEVDDSAERMNAKIRNAQLQKIPYMLVIGDREAAEGMVNVRLRTGEQRGAMPVAEFAAYARDVVARKALI